MGVESVVAQVSAENAKEEKKFWEVNIGLGINETIVFENAVYDPDVHDQKAEVHDLKKAVDEWPARTKVLPFYIMKYMKYDDRKVKEKIDVADEEFTKLEDDCREIKEKLEAQKSDLAQVVSGGTRQYRIMAKKRREIESMRRSLGGRAKGFDICSSEKELDEQNTPYYQNLALLRDVRRLAVKKDAEGLKELCDTEVEKFMSSWNNKKIFRDDYVKRILPSLDFRCLSRDGRRRNPDEKSVEKSDVKQHMQKPVPPQQDTYSVRKEEEEEKEKEMRKRDEEAQKEAKKRDFYSKCLITPRLILNVYRIKI